MWPGPLRLLGAAQSAVDGGAILVTISALSMMIVRPGIDGVGRVQACGVTVDRSKSDATSDLGGPMPRIGVE
jgi:hypothetical protein